MEPATHIRPSRSIASRLGIIVALPLLVIIVFAVLLGQSAQERSHSELVSFSVTPAEGGASGFVIAVAVR